ncbi:MAG: FAD-binding protein [Chloroflexi bacterium]|nr:FAD-binding protein [Chloroflexota bacterium]
MTGVEPGLLEELRALLGPAQVHAGPAELVAYSYDGTFQQAVPALAVTPGSTAEVQAVVTLAAKHDLPIIPRGAGTGLAGGTIPSEGALVLSLARMSRVLEVDRANQVVVAEAGVVTADLQRRVEREGLFYPPDPASLQQCTIGGNVATNAGGPRCLKYGVTKDYVLGLTVVLADGREMPLGGKVIKSSTGYQLGQLFVGSEGTLGIVTEVILRLLPLPRERAALVAHFDRLEDAAEAVVRIVASGLTPAALELLDALCIQIVEEHVAMGLPLDAEALLIIEQDGSDAATVQRQIGELGELCRAARASAVQVSRDAAEREAVWTARRAMSPALGRRSPNKLGEDIVVPRSQLPSIIRRIRAIGEEHGFEIPVFGHAGDGNLHPNILFDRRRPGEMERLERAAEAIFRAALDLGGTLSGEHGIGTLKREFIEAARGSVAVDVMRALKAALDPKGILNPGKVLPVRGAGSGFLTTLPALEGLVPG